MLLSAMIFNCLPFWFSLSVGLWVILMVFVLFHVVHFISYVNQIIT